MTLSGLDDYWALDASDVAAHLRSGRDGLDSADAATRRTLAFA
jgi:hypothetical protein